MVVRCTARLLAMLPTPALDEVPSGSDDWYASLLWIDRRKCLLLVHSGTLFPVFVADVRKPQLVAFGQFAAGAIFDALADEDLPADQLGPLDPPTSASPAPPVVRSSDS